MNLSEKLPRSWIIGYVVVLVGATAFYASNPPWRETMGFFLNGLSSAAVILGALYIAEAVLLAARTIGLPGKAGGGEGGKEIDKFWKEFCDALKVLKPDDYRTIYEALERIAHEYEHKLPDRVLGRYRWPCPAPPHP